MNNTRKGDIYPAKYFDESPTWNRWNKLTAADVFQLRQERGFEGQNIWFWLNHPIQWVRLVGLICQIDMVGFGKFVLLTLDDSSGANIEIKLERLVAGKTPNGPEYSTCTTIAGVYVFVKNSLPYVYLDDKPIGIGSVIKAEGKIESYSQSRQLSLQRISSVKNTHDEAVHWSKAADWKRRVLNNPWILPSADRHSLDLKLIQDEKRRLRRERHTQMKRAKVEELNEKEQKREEERRQALEREFNEAALKGSDILRMPWDN